MSRILTIAITATVAVAAGAAVAAFFVLHAAVRDIETAIAKPVTVANPVETVTVSNPVETVTVANPTETVTIANPVETVTVANPVETVTVSNPVETVTVANPVETVTVANPVDEVKVTNIVETASPRNSTLYGYCFPADGDGYEINVVAFSGGIEKTVAAGSYANGDTASLLALEITDYYGGPLDFGISSEGCHDLDGWGS